MIAALRIASRVLVFFCFPFNVFGYQAYFVPDIHIFNDLVALNTTCIHEDLCLEEREDDSPLIPPGGRCSCHAQCAVYDTCCFNSPHRGYSLPLMECTNILGSGAYFVVGKCPFDARGDSVWKRLCEDPWNGEDDILKIAPVTSLDTRTVYKSVYCFRCNERSDNFHQWYLNMEGFTTDETADSKNYAPSYDQAYGTWMAVSDDKYASFRVDLYFSSAPEKFSVEYVHRCRTDVISDCHDSWTDDHVRDKCRGYNALRFAGFGEYKNPHCAICNYEPPEDISCTEKGFGGGAGQAGYGGQAGGGFGGKWFSFRRLLGGMFYGGDSKSEKLQNKCSENHLWDPYGERCRKIACALPGYVVRNGRCTRL